MELSVTKRPSQDFSFPSPTWIWDRNSNIHVAQHRAWFGDDYTPLSTCITTVHSNQKVQVIGIGTVLLPTDLLPDDADSSPDSSPHTILRLTEVLHAPALRFNLIGRTNRDPWKIVTYAPNQQSRGYIIGYDCRKLGYFKNTPAPGIFELQVSGPPVGPVVGNPPWDLLQTNYNLSHYWSSYESQRAADWTSVREKNFATSGPLTSFELAWLKVCFGGKSPALRNFNTDIFNDKFQEEGRAILRELAGCRDLRPCLRPESCPLTPTELRWFDNHYGHRFESLHRLGELIFKPEFIPEGRSLLRTIMSNDERHPSRTAVLSEVDRILSDEAKEWLSTHGWQFLSFLNFFGLKRTDSEHRQEGVSILRALMHNEANNPSFDLYAERELLFAERLMPRWTELMEDPPELKTYKFRDEETFLSQPITRRFICFDCEKVEFFFGMHTKIWTTSGSGEILLPAGFKVVAYKGKARMF